MKKPAWSIKAKPILSLTFMLLTLLFFVLLIAYKDKLTAVASTMVKAQANSEIQNSELAFVDSAYNYVKNGQGYEATFLEFGATGCSPCKRMESVMEEIRTRYPDRVKVVFINILKPENQDLMKYFGIAAIPTQVLLNKEGKEFFRHTGYYSTNDLIKNFQKK